MVNTSLIRVLTQEVAGKLAVSPHRKKGWFFSTDFGLRFFYTNPSQILVSLADFCVKKIFERCSQIRIFTHRWHIYTSVEYLHICGIFTQVSKLHNTTIRNNYISLCCLIDTCVNIPQMCKYSTDVLLHTLKETLQSREPPSYTRRGQRRPDGGPQRPQHGKSFY